GIGVGAGQQQLVRHDPGDHGLGGPQPGRDPVARGWLPGRHGEEAHGGPCLDHRVVARAAAARSSPASSTASEGGICWAGHWQMKGRGPGGAAPPAHPWPPWGPLVLWYSHGGSGGWSPDVRGQRRGSLSARRPSAKRTSSRSSSPHRWARSWCWRGCRGWRRTARSKSNPVGYTSRLSTRTAWVSVGATSSPTGTTPGTMSSGPWPRLAPGSRWAAAWEQQREEAHRGGWSGQRGNAR